ncbi:MAG TPA: hypothetical protein VFQ00_04365 [Terriglobales bacterium]|nr:hypothetical protein [Terriglobales bacterium]
MKNMSFDKFAIGTLLILALAVAVPVGLTQEKPAQRAAQQNAAQEKHNPAGQETRGGPHEGIKVHGHWLIVIRNADGSVASLHEFENKLSPFFATPFLAKLLARQASVGFWRIDLLTVSVTGTQPCSLGGTPSGCFIDEPGNPGAVSNSFKNLTVTATGGTFILAGTATVTASQTAEIDQVSTHFIQCGPTLDPSKSCPSATGGEFTSHPESITGLVPGQHVDVTVTISFS